MVYSTAVRDRKRECLNDSGGFSSFFLLNYEQWNVYEIHFIAQIDDPVYLFYILNEKKQKPTHASKLWLTNASASLFIRNIRPSFLHFQYLIGALQSIIRDP